MYVSVKWFFSFLICTPNNILSKNSLGLFASRFTFAHSIFLKFPLVFVTLGGNLHYRCQNSHIQCHLAAQWPRSPISTPLFLLWDCSVCMCEARCEGRCFLTSKHKTWNMSHCPPFQTLYAPPLKLSFQKYHWGMGFNHGCVRIKGKCKDKIYLQSFSLKGQPPIDFILFIFLFLFLLNLFLCS